MNGKSDLVDPGPSNERAGPGPRLDRCRGHTLLFDLQSFPNPVPTAPSELYFPAFSKLGVKLLIRFCPHEPEADDCGVVFVDLSPTIPANGIVFIGIGVIQALTEALPADPGAANQFLSERSSHQSFSSSGC